MSYTDKLKDPKWQRRRLEIMERDGWRCQICGELDISLTVHHIRYLTPNPWEAEGRDLITYCEFCNAMAHTMNGCIHNQLFGTLGCFPSCVGFGGMSYGDIKCRRHKVTEYLNWINDVDPDPLLHLDDLPF